MDGQTLTANDLLEEIFFLEKAVLSLKQKVLKAMPVKYGSEAWWEKEIAKSQEEIEAGKGILIKNQAELQKFFNL